MRSGTCLRSFDFQAADTTADGRTLEGYAAVFDSPARIRDIKGPFEETIRCGAFEQSLSTRTPILQWDHGRDPAVGTAPIGDIETVHEDNRGLFVRARLYDHPTMARRRPEQSETRETAPRQACRTRLKRGRSKMAATSVDEHRHLPGKHNQKTHANRYRVPGNRASGLLPSRAELLAEATRVGVSIPTGTREARIAALIDEHRAKTEAAPKPTASPSRMTRSQYTRLLKEEHIRLAMLDGASEAEARRAARPAATIDELKERNAELRRRLRSRGVDHRTDEQRRTDDAEKNTLLDEVERLATAGGHDGPAKRAAAARMSVPELRKFVTDVKEYQRRQEEKTRADREGAAAREAFQRRQAAAPATARQVDYIVSLLIRRQRSGEGGGFMVGPTDRAGIARLSRGEASAYIDSLTGNY